MATIPLDTVRDAATATLGVDGPAASGPEANESGGGLVPYGAAAKKVLELTFREALRLGHNYIGTEHILLALLEVEPTTEALTALGLAKADVEAQIVSQLAMFHERSGMPRRRNVATFPIRVSRRAGRRTRA